MQPVTWLLLAYVVLFGLIIGSFIALAAVRIPAGESVFAPRSHCRTCARVLKWHENIPVLSYFMLRGRCRGCRSPISARYPVMEVATAALTVLTYLEVQPWPRFLVYLLLFVLPLWLLVLIDWEHLLLPDVITVPGIAAGFLVHWLDGQYLQPISFGASHYGLLQGSLLGMIAGGGTLFLIGEIYLRLRGREGMGGGDIKMAAMIGAFVGWKAVFLIFFLASLLGILLGILWILLGRAGRDTPLPFGSCLGLAAILFLFRGPWLLENYLSLIRKIV